MAVKGARKLKTRLPLAIAWTAVGVLLLAGLPRVLLLYLDPGIAFLISALAAIPFLLQGPAALMMKKQMPPLLKLLERLGPESEILSSKPFTLYSYFLKLRVIHQGTVHEFYYGYWPFRFRSPPHITMVWPTTRKGISFQNRLRFNNFSKKFNTMEYTYVRDWAIRLFAYPVKGDFWWFDLYLFKGAQATENHLWECFQIAIETKDKLTRQNPAF